MTPLWLAPHHALAGLPGSAVAAMGAALGVSRDAWFADRWEGGLRHQRFATKASRP